MTAPPGQPFVSYAQNFEDVVLWRALREVREGFYIDVGAFSPREDSVTLAFYERGWSGINVEPNLEAFYALCEARPRDVNVHVALGDRPGTSDMAFFAGSGLSTLKAHVAEQRIREGRDAVTSRVQIETLAAIWTTYVPADRDVHFLKVDVEGAEREVLAGLDWREHRPWIVVVEATRPQSREPAYQEWEDLLTDAAYRCIYDDGLNRFYLAEEQNRLREHFRHPPNFFDNFVTARLVDAEARAHAIERDLRRLQGSWSWRLTRPLRFLRRTIYLSGLWSPTSRVQSVGVRRARGLLLGAMKAVLRKRRLRAAAASALHRIPAVETRLRAVLLRDANIMIEPPVAVDYDIDELSPRAQDIHRRLRRLAGWKEQ